MKEAIIYIYTNLINGKIYIGQTLHPNKRFSAHKRAYHDNSTFHFAIKKYGFENFKYEILHTFNYRSKEEAKILLNFWEKFYIKECDSANKNVGYNLTQGGDGTVGYKLTAERRKKISNFMKAHPNSGMYHKGNIPYNKGVPCSEVTKHKLSEYNKKHPNSGTFTNGHVVSEDIKIKIRVEKLYLNNQGEIVAMRPSLKSRWHPEWKEVNNDN